MAITQALCTSFKKALLDGEMDFSSDTSDVFKIALYTSSASLDATTTAYTTSDEVTGSGYSAGGKTIIVSTYPTTSGTTAYLSFKESGASGDTVTWTSASITAHGALIYKYDTVTNPAIAVLNFGADKTSTSGDFQIVFPTADASSAIIRIA